MFLGGEFLGVHLILAARGCLVNGNLKLESQMLAVLVGN
jgi:hypothetical protein